MRKLFQALQPYLIPKRLAPFFLYITDGYKVYPCLIEDCNHLVSKTAMTRVEGENCRLRHYLARLHRKTLCYSKSTEMLYKSIRLLIYYLKHGQLPPFS
ncbi:IS1 family transposase [Limnospira sp. PMC 289.06]|uniref:IS1 family transposase n=1 Tax=Limnospira sp. PMC 289.06 TaxID=2981094 RepID=UPI00257019CD